MIPLKINLNINIGLNSIAINLNYDPPNLIVIVSSPKWRNNAHVIQFKFS